MKVIVSLPSVRMSDFRWSTGSLLFLRKYFMHQNLFEALGLV